MNRNNPVLYIVIPCYNEEKVLPYTNPMFVEKIETLIEKGKVHPQSKVMYVNDGSKDATWELIQQYSMENSHVVGIAQSRNRGHQSSVLAGMHEAAKFADIVITIDADGQDDINCMDQMVAEYKDGSEIVYGVRDNRDTDSAFKRITAEGFYKVMHLFGADVVFNHADYRLVSKRFIHELAKFKEVNLFLRGIMPLVGFKYSYVTYKRHERIAGESHYPLAKMLGLAIDGITSLIVISIPTSSYLLKKYYQNVTHNPIPQGVPMISFVTMGTQDNPNVPTLGGWWDGYNTSVLVENDFDQSKAVQQAKSDLKENLRTFYKQPKYALKFFYKKILSTWLEPTFQSIWTGPLTEKGNIQNSRILKSIYEEKSGYYFLNSFGKVFTVSIYLLALIAVIYYIISKKFSVFELFTIIFFLGGFFFHLLWETKSQYVFIYVLLLIPTAANGLDKITSILYKKGVISNSN